MPLDPTILRDALRQYVDPDYSGYVGFPADGLAVGVAWAGAMRDYFNGIVSPPGITPAQQTAGEAAFAAIFQPTFSSDALTLLNSALAAYAALLVSPAGATVPPPAPPVIVLVNTSDGNAAATTIATAIDLWARTGTYTPPVGPVVPWS